jgi:hypothetical protein
MTDPTSAPSDDDARALDLIQASGVLNLDLTLDKLMDVTRRLNELDPALDGGVPTTNVFLHRFFCFRHLAPSPGSAADN